MDWLAVVLETVIEITVYSLLWCFVLHVILIRRADQEESRNERAQREQAAARRNQNEHDQEHEHEPGSHDEPPGPS